MKGPFSKFTRADMKFITSQLKEDEIKLLTMQPLLIKTKSIYHLYYIAIYGLFFDCC